MRKSISLVLVAILFIGLAACSSNGKTLSEKEISIISTSDDKSKISYGDNRTDVEKILGTESDAGSGSLVMYETASVWYRNEKVVGLAIDEDSGDAFVTGSGAKIGMKKADIEKAYGKRYITSKGLGIDYIYNTKEKKWLVDPAEIDSSKLKDYFHISVVFEDEKVKRIIICDQEAAMLGK